MTPNHFDFRLNPCNFLYFQEREKLPTIFTFAVEFIRISWVAVPEISFKKCRHAKIDIFRYGTYRIQVCVTLVGNYVTVMHLFNSHLGLGHPELNPVNAIGPSGLLNM